MTPELLRRLLEQSILAIQLIDCVIFDECHHVLGQDGAMVGTFMPTLFTFTLNRNSISILWIKGQSMRRYIRTMRS